MCFGYGDVSVEALIPAFDDGHFTGSSNFSNDVDRIHFRTICPLHWDLT
jgi:hypothetical protein